MNYTYKDNTDEVLSALEKAIENGLKAIGMTAEGHAKRKITDYPAVDTGRLRNSITYALSGEKPSKSYYYDNSGNAYLNEGAAPKDKEKAVYIGTNVEYASHVELGTSKMGARPFLKPSATEHNEEYQKIMETSLKSADP
jgi:HK97 gp10 family phage protein